MPQHQRRQARDENPQDQRAEVHVAAVGYDVTSGTAGGKVAVEKRGDSWLVTVNNFHFYTISEAVIEGGQPQPATSR